MRAVDMGGWIGGPVVGMGRSVARPERVCLAWLRLFFGVR